MCYTRGRSNDETRDKNVNGYNCWLRLRRGRLTSGVGEMHQGREVGKEGGRDDRGMGYHTPEGGTTYGGGGRDTRRIGRFCRMVPRILAFIRVVSSSFRRWIPRLASAADSPAVSLPL